MKRFFTLRDVLSLENEALGREGDVDDDRIRERAFCPPNTLQEILECHTPTDSSSSE